MSLELKRILTPYCYNAELHQQLVNTSLWWTWLIQCVQRCPKGLSATASPPLRHHALQNVPPPTLRQEHRGAVTLSYPPGGNLLDTLMSTTSPASFSRPCVLETAHSSLTHVTGSHPGKAAHVRGPDSLEGGHGLSRTGRCCSSALGAPSPQGLG